MEITQSSGLELERNTEALLRLFPGATVQAQVELLGKKVDLLCVLPAHLVPAVTIAVECKDWATPLTRRQCAEVLADYSPLLSKSVDQFLLITRNGIVPNGRKLFDGQRTQHLSFSQLADRLLDPNSLVDNLERQYVSDGLDRYYTGQRALAPPLEIAASHYDLLYNEFMELALETNSGQLDKAMAAWTRYGGDEVDWGRKYSDSLFEGCYQARRGGDNDLEQYVLDWISRADVSHGLALLGGYGTGKSSFARRLAYLCARQYKSNSLARFPFLIELKEFGSHQDIRGLVTHELVNRHGVSNGSFELFQSLNAAGRVVIILDGFDEMKQGMTLDSLLFNFNQLSILHTQKSKILLCGRPTVFETQVEQNRILNGDTRSIQSSFAKYVQLEVEPFGIEDVYQFLDRYTECKHPSSLLQMRTFIAELKRVLTGEFQMVTTLNSRGRVVRKRALVRDEQLAARIETLVRRPVHLPMLAAVLPRRALRLDELRRSVLYDEFITAIIERELLKRRPEFQSLYPATARREFARELSFEMWSRGQARSIRSSEIPDRLFEPFARPGRPLEGVKRDLISACFLERKAPDILFVQHKSFLEFLVAERVSLAVKRGDTVEDLGTVTEELFSFIFEMISEEEWTQLLQTPDRNHKLLVMWLKVIRRSTWSAPDIVEKAWCEGYDAMSQQMRWEVVEYYEMPAAGDRASAHLKGRSVNRGMPLSPYATEFLTRCLGDLSDVIAVHAFRILQAQSVLPDTKVLAHLVGLSRLAAWSPRWVDFGHEMEETLQRQLLQLQLISSLMHWQRTIEK